MFKRREIYLILLAVLVAWTVYVYVNKEYFIVEHMVDVDPTLNMVSSKVDILSDKVDKLTPEQKPVPTLYSVDSKVDETNKRLDNLITKFEEQNKKMEEGASRAQSAQAALQAVSATPSTATPILPSTSMDLNSLLPSTGQSTM